MRNCQENVTFMSLSCHIDVTFLIKSVKAGAPFGLFLLLNSLHYADLTLFV